MSGDNCLRRGMARVEFLACMETVESMRGEGVSKQLIYERLKDAGRISMAYVTFAKLISKASKNALPRASLRQSAKPAAPSAPNLPTSRPQPPRQPGIIKAESKTFPDPRTMNPNDSF
jgi:hypothetical protein